MKVMSRLQKLVVLLLLAIFTGGILHAFATVGTRIISVFRHPDTTQRRSRPQKGSSSVKNFKGMRKGNCMMWVNTAGCTPSGRPEPENYGPCRDAIAQGRSGYCQCSNYTIGHSNCGHAEFSCEQRCSSNVADCLGWVTSGSCIERQSPKVRAIKGNFKYVPAPKPVPVWDQAGQDKVSCVSLIPPNISGYCQCGARKQVEYLSCSHEHLTCGVVCDRNARGEATSSEGDSKSEPKDEPPESPAHSKWARMAAEIKSNKQAEESTPIEILDSSAIVASEAPWMESNKDSVVQSTRRLMRGSNSGHR